jgi:LysM repeat protein
MDLKRMIPVMILSTVPFSFVVAQDGKGSKAVDNKEFQSLKSDVDAMQSLLKAQEARIDKLSQQLTALNETAKPKNSATPADTPAEKPVAGVDNAVPVANDNLRTHVVAKGETLTLIARKYGVTVDEIQELNKIQDAKKLKAGQKIKIPATAKASRPSVPATGSSATPSASPSESPTSSPSPTATPAE